MVSWKVRSSAFVVLVAVSVSICADFLVLNGARAESPAASTSTVAAQSANSKKSPEQLRQEIAELTKKIEAEPKVAKNYGRRGLRYHDLSKYEQALKDFDVAIALEPKESRVYGFKGDVYYDQRKWKEAIAQFSLAVAVEPNNVSHLIRRSICYRKANQPSKALDDARKSQALDPSSSDGPFQVGMCLLDLSKYEDAVKSFSEAIRLNSGEGEYYYFRAYANTKLNKLQSAKEDELRARKLGFH